MIEGELNESLSQSNYNDNHSSCLNSLDNSRKLTPTTDERVHEGDPDIDADSYGGFAIKPNRSFVHKNTKKAMASIAPILEGFKPKTSASENTSLRLPGGAGTTESSFLENNPRSMSVGESFAAQKDLTEIKTNRSASVSATSLTANTELDEFTDRLNKGSDVAVEFPSDSPSDTSITRVSDTNRRSCSGSSINSNASPAARKSSVVPKRALPTIGKIGVCAMDAKVLSKPMRHILNRLIEHGEFETIIFGDKVILDEAIENWPTCDFLISFFSSGFPLDKAVKYANLRKPYLINDLSMQKVLWDRRLCLRILEASKVPSPPRLEISRDGGPKVDHQLRSKLLDIGVHVEPESEPEWRMQDEDTLQVNGKTMVKPYVEKPVDGEDHNIYIYYHSKNGGGGRRLFRKVGNKSSEFDPTLSSPRTVGSYIYEKFMDTDNFEDVKAYTVGDNYCHAETRKSPVVDGIVRRNTHGKEVRYVTELTAEETEMAKKISLAFSQMICGFDLLRVAGKSYVIDVNGFSFVKDNKDYYDSCAKILRNTFIEAKKKMDDKKHILPMIREEKKQKWVFKGLVTVIRHADRTPKQKFKHSFTSPIFISLLKGYKEEVVIRNVSDLEIVLKALKIALVEKAGNPYKLKLLADTLEKKIELPGTKIQLKPILTPDNKVEKVQFILKWGGEPTHSAYCQATELGEQTRQDFDLLNKEILQNIKIFSSSERRVMQSAQYWATALFGQDKLDIDEISIRKDLLDDSNAAKDLMDKVKKKLKLLLREGKEAPPEFAWPPKMPEPYLVIKRVVELMNYHKKIMNYNFTHSDVTNMQKTWCTSEDPYLFKERWEKLFKEFITVEKVDPSKISELYDTMKYDALHNRQFLECIFKPTEGCENVLDLELGDHSLVDRYPINVLAKNNFKIVESKTQSGGSLYQNNTSGTLTPALSVKSNNESANLSSANGSSGTSEGRVSVGSLGWVLEKHHNENSNSSSPFDSPEFSHFQEMYKLAKVLFDFICPKEYGISNEEKLDIGLLTSLPLAKQILNDVEDMKKGSSPACVAYFTKESHIYTLLNIIYESGIPMRIARNALPEFDYLSQINFELYESTDASSGRKTHSIRLKMSPGCHTQDPLDVQLDQHHYISCIPKISLTKHLDMDYVQKRVRTQFDRVIMPRKFTPVNITNPNLSFNTKSC